MIMVGDYIYAAHGDGGPGLPTCLHWTDKGNTMWRSERLEGRSGSAAVACADGNLYFRHENGVVTLVAVDPEKYVERGKFQIPDVHDPSWAHPVIAGGKLYLREQDALYCYDIRQK